MKPSKTDLELALAHKYKFNNGHVPGSTTITGLVDDQKSGRMAGAAAKITREGGNYRAEWKAKTDRGTRVHGYMERWIDNEDAHIVPGDAGFLDAGGKFFVDHPHEWMHVERIIVGDGYGGRMDAIGLDEHRRVVLRDWKTGREYDEHIMQLASYVFGLGFAMYDTDGMFCGLEPIPHIEVASCVYLNEDGTYTAPEHDRDELAEAYDAFCGLLGVYNWLKGRKAAA